MRRWTRVIQEIDLETGELLWEWSSLEHVGLTESLAGIPQKTRFPYDYFHINSIDVDDDGDLLVSARNTWAIYKLNRDSGEVIWRLGGYRSDFALGAGVRFAWQHDARRQPDGTLTLFDNQATPKVGPRSRALTLRLDEDTMRATATKILEHPDGILSIAQGNSQVLPDGSTFVGFGSGRRISEFDPEGKLRFDLRFPADCRLLPRLSLRLAGRAVRRPARDRDPLRRPGRASRRAGTAPPRSPTGRCSPADRRTPLAPAGKAHRRGFETTIPVSADPAFIAVRALAGTRELGRSQAVRVPPG